MPLKTVPNLDAYGRSEPSFDFEDATVIVHGKNKSAQDMNEVGFLEDNSINRHIELHPIYQVLKTSLGHVAMDESTRIAWALPHASEASTAAMQADPAVTKTYESHIATGAIKRDTRSVTLARW